MWYSMEQQLCRRFHVSQKYNSIAKKYLSSSSLSFLAFNGFLVETLDSSWY